MTDCTNAEMRDLLPDLAAESLSAADISRVRAHVASCAVCAEELALIARVRALRAQPIAIDVGAIVAKLPKPVARAEAALPAADNSVISLDARRAIAAQAPARRAVTPTRSWGAWKLAAALGVMVAGGWSVMLIRSGGIPSVQMSADSVPLSDVPTATVASGATPRSADSAPVRVVDPANAESDEGAAISFGGMANLTDEELARVLDRLEKWDGATSSEGTTTSPILPSGSGAGRE